MEEPSLSNQKLSNPTLSDGETVNRSGSPASEGEEPWHIKRPVTRPQFFRKRDSSVATLPLPFCHSVPRVSHGGASAAVTLGHSPVSGSAHALWHDTRRCPLFALHEQAESTFKHAQSVHVVSVQIADGSVPAGPPDDRLQYCLSVHVCAPHANVAPA